MRRTLLRCAAAALLAALAGSALALPAAPEQPFRFSHKVHAGDARIGCTSCHAYAERGPVAGVPSMARCNGCHKFVKEDRQDPKLDAELKALRKVLDKVAEDGKPVEWVRVHRVPDHVFFTHQRHVVTAKLACQECHGPVETMEAVRQVAPLTMGWCLGCHEQKKGPTDCWACHK
jgi:Cytochrome c7 and related cytochrome c/Class III cytochrome C family